MWFESTVPHSALAQQRRSETANCNESFRLRNTVPSYNGLVYLTLTQMALVRFQPGQQRKFLRKASVSDTVRKELLLCGVIG